MATSAGPGIRPATADKIGQHGRIQPCRSCPWTSGGAMPLNMPGARICRVFWRAARARARPERIWPGPCFVASC